MVRADGVAVTTIDTVVDGVHFRLATHSPADVGWKAMATALSDLAAMGAEAGEAYVALGLPDDFGDDAARELVGAMEELAALCGVHDRRRRRDRVAGAVRDGHRDRLGGRRGRAGRPRRRAARRPGRA